MISTKKLLLTLFAASTLILPASSFAEDKMDVDLSDSLNFEEFHKDKPDAFKLWEDKDDVTRTYQETPKTEAADNAKPEPQEKVAAGENPPADPNRGKRYEIRELYSISGSERTGYNPNTVVQALYLQMQGYCPKGWKKLDERSVPDGSDAFFMYYSFECL